LDGLDSRPAVSPKEAESHTPTFTIAKKKAGLRL
jgi:hypothetical protein